MEALLKFLRTNRVETRDGVQRCIQNLMTEGTLEVHGDGCPSDGKGEGFAKYLSYTPLISRKRTSTSIVSSRLGRKLDQRDDFFRVLRIACSQLDPRRQLLLSSKHTATHPYVVRAAELFGLDVLEPSIAKPNRSLEHWLDSCSQLSSDDNVLMVWPLASNSTSGPPMRDIIAVDCADQVLAISLRNKGNTNALLQHRTTHRDSPRVYLAIGSEQLVTQSVAEPLMEQGAIGWYLMSPKIGDSVRLLNADSKPQEEQSVCKLSELPDPTRFLTHCTRGTHGPWPDQTETDFLDELILGSVSRDRSALAALTRIVGQRTILATGDAIRTGAPVVSLTSVALTDISSLRQFRSHRGRWDFEPYGIAIDREFLVQLGARPAIYGDEQTWESLSAEDQPFYQRVGSEENSIDWRIEKEFRVLGDIDLDSVPTDKAIVFVPTYEEANHLAQISKWPICVMN